MYTQIILHFRLKENDKEKCKSLCIKFPLNYFKRFFSETLYKIKSKRIFHQNSFKAQWNDIYAWYKIND